MQPSTSTDLELPRSGQDPHSGHLPRDEHPLRDKEPGPAELPRAEGFEGSGDETIDREGGVKRDFEDGGGIEEQDDRPNKRSRAEYLEMYYMKVEKPDKIETDEGDGFSGIGPAESETIPEGT